MGGGTCPQCPLGSYAYAEAFSTTCTVHIEDCEGWWLSGCRSSVAEHWRLKPWGCPGFDSWQLPA